MKFRYVLPISFSATSIYIFQLETVPDASKSTILRASPIHAQATRRDVCDTPHVFRSMFGKQSVDLIATPGNLPKADVTLHNCSHVWQCKPHGVRQLYRAESLHLPGNPSQLRRSGQRYKKHTVYEPPALTLNHSAFCPYSALR